MTNWAKAAGGPSAVIAVALAAMCLLLPFSAGASTLGGRILEAVPVAEGILLEKRVVAAGGEKVLVFVLKADLGNQYLKMNTLVGSGGTMDKNARVTDMAVGAGAVAAVNADFFQMLESARPIGMTYRDGQMLTSPPARDDMYGWAVNREGVPLIDLFSFRGGVTAGNGISFPLAGVNKPSYITAGGKNSHEDSLLLYNRYWGQSSRGRVGEKDQVVEVFVENETALEIRVSQPGKAIPAKGFVLAGRGVAAEYIKANIKVGEKVKVNYSVLPDGDKIWSGTGGWSLLVRDGLPVPVQPSGINGLNARTALGYTRDRKTLYVVVVEKSTFSRGFTLDELAEYMSRLGVDRALNLDGGGSSTMVARPLGEEKAVLVNTPQKEVQRPVPSAMAFFSTAPGGNLAGLVVRGPGRVLPGDRISYALKGYDSHYNPHPVNPEDVSWRLASGKGVLYGNDFTAGESGVVVISASHRGMRAEKTIRVLGSGEIEKITVSPSAVEVLPGEAAALKISARDQDGNVYPLSPVHYTVSLDPGLGQMENGLFRASEKPGTGEIKISFLGTAAMVPVTVKAGEKSVYEHIPAQPGTMVLGDLDISFGSGAFISAATVIATYGNVLPGPVPGRYKPVSAVVLHSPDNAAALSEPAAAAWRFAPGEDGRIAVIQFLGGGWREVPSKIVGNRVFFTFWELAPVVLVRDNKPPEEFKDMARHWSAGAVAKLSSAGVVNGYPGNIFAPDRQITRAEFVVMICRAMGWQPAQADGQFLDSGSMPGWASGYIRAAARRGLVSGYGDNTFRPSNPVTRAEMAVMINRLLSLPPAGDAVLSGIFTDGGSVPPWAVDQVSRIYAAGIMKGDGQKKFRPRDKATRAESAVLVDSALNYLNNR